MPDQPASDPLEDFVGTAHIAAQLLRVSGLNKRRVDFRLAIEIEEMLDDFDFDPGPLEMLHNAPVTDANKLRLGKLLSAADWVRNDPEISDEDRDAVLRAINSCGGRLIMHEYEDSVIREALPEESGQALTLARQFDEHLKALGGDLDL